MPGRRLTPRERVTRALGWHLRRVRQAIGGTRVTYAAHYAGFVLRQLPTDEANNLAHELSSELIKKANEAYAKKGAAV